MDREEMISRFAKFLREYVDDEGNEVYINRLKDLLTVTPKRSLAIDWAHLNSFDPELAEELLNNPEEAIASCEDAIQIILREPPLLVEREGSRALLQPSQYFTRQGTGERAHKQAHSG